MLQDLTQNPHATLLMLFMNAVPEMAERAQDMAAQRSGMMRAMKYLRFASPPTTQYDPQTIMLMSSMSLVLDFDRHFEM